MLSNYLKKQDLERLNEAWAHLTLPQRAAIFARVIPHLAIITLNRHIQRRLSRIPYTYTAHWVR